MIAPGRTRSIADYAALGDGRSAAIVSRDGSIDWLCWPRFDSPSLFGALLDSEEGGRFRITAPHATRIERRYLPGTNVLETRFETPSGEAVLTDAMVLGSEEEAAGLLAPESELLRHARCVRGEVVLDLEATMRPCYGARRPHARARRALGVSWEVGHSALTLLTDRPVELRDGSVHARVPLRAGEEASASLTYALHAPAVLRPRATVAAAIERTAAAWRAWSGRCRYRGPYAAAVERSLLALKLLVFLPSGAIIAAPTTSLPERVGGDLNWDYRYCWLRDSAFTVRALFALGYPEEARAFSSWLLHATRLTRPALRVLYDVYGRAPRAERTLDFAGFEGSRPVRIGNAAADQMQLDVYGEVVQAASLVARQGHVIDRATESMLRAIARYICDHWREPDAGIWEVRSGLYRHTHSLALAYVALERLCALEHDGHLRRRLPPRFAETRDAIRREVEARAWNEHLGAYAAHLDGETLDAAVLLLGLHGFERPRSERMRRTVARIREHLAAGPGLLYRYRTGESPGEGAFLVCTFWLVQCLARAGEKDEARRIFEDALRYANDVGLLSEEVEPGTAELLGNFPQGFSHVGVINAALALEEAA